MSKFIKKITKWGMLCLLIVLIPISANAWQIITDTNWALPNETNFSMTTTAGSPTLTLDSGNTFTIASPVSFTGAVTQIGDFTIQGQAAGFAIVNTTSLGKLKFYGDDDSASADEIGGQIEVVSDAT